MQGVPHPLKTEWKMTLEKQRDSQREEKGKGGELNFDRIANRANLGRVYGISQLSWQL